MSKLEDLLASEPSVVEKADTIIFDGMAVIQLLQVQSIHNTFMDMALSFLKYILMKAREVYGVTSIHDVFDKYRKQSPKSETRRERGDSASTIVHISGNLRVPKDWKVCSSSGTKKERLFEYYTGYMKEKECNYLTCQEINSGNNGICIEVTSDDWNETTALKSNQEEADTVMIFHAKYAGDTGSSSVVVQSPDTDVLVFLLHHYKFIGAKSLYMSTGRVTTHTDLRRYISVNRLTEKLSDEHSRIILAVYCLTGWDSLLQAVSLAKERNRCLSR